MGSSAPLERDDVLSKWQRLTTTDHTLVAAALVAGVATWQGRTGGLCIGGIWHALDLDDFGVPVLTNEIRLKIAWALSACTPAPARPPAGGEGSE